MKDGMKTNNIKLSQLGKRTLIHQSEIGGIKTHINPFLFPPGTFFGIVDVPYLYVFDGKDIINIFTGTKHKDAGEWNVYILELDLSNNFVHWSRSKNQKLGKFFIQHNLDNLSRQEILKEIRSAGGFPQDVNALIKAFHLEVKQFLSLNKPKSKTNKRKQP